MESECVICGGTPACDASVSRKRVVSSIEKHVLKHVHTMLALLCGPALCGSATDQTY